MPKTAPLFLCRRCGGGRMASSPPEHLGKANLRLYPAGEVVHTDHNKNSSRFDEGNHKDGAVSLPVG